MKAKRAQSVADDESWKEGGVSPTLNGFDNNSESRATVVATFEVMPDNAQGRVPGGLVARATDTAPTLTGTQEAAKTDRGARVAIGFGVRRLTPRECERLMGWPDDHTRYTADGVEVADSARYRMCGNGVAAPVAKYVAECIGRLL